MSKDTTQPDKEANSEVSKSTTSQGVLIGVVTSSKRYAAEAVLAECDVAVVYSAEAHTKAGTPAHSYSITTKSETTHGWNCAAIVDALNTHETGGKVFPGVGKIPVKAPEMGWHVQQETIVSSNYIYSGLKPAKVAKIVQETMSK